MAPASRAVPSFWGAMVVDGGVFYGVFFRVYEWIDIFIFRFCFSLSLY